LAHHPVILITTTSQNDLQSSVLLWSHLAPCCALGAFLTLEVMSDLSSWQVCSCASLVCAQIEPVPLLLNSCSGRATRQMRAEPPRLARAGWTMWLVCAQQLVRELRTRVTGTSMQRASGCARARTSVSSDILRQIKARERWRGRAGGWQRVNSDRHNNWLHSFSCDRDVRTHFSTHERTKTRAPTPTYIHTRRLCTAIKR
jgi:hypothetical protein